MMSGAGEGVRSELLTHSHQRTVLSFPTNAALTVVGSGFARETARLSMQCTQRARLSFHATVTLRSLGVQSEGEALPFHYPVPLPIS